MKAISWNSFAIYISSRNKESSEVAGEGEANEDKDINPDFGKLAC